MKEIYSDTQKDFENVLSTCPSTPMTKTWKINFNIGEGEETSGCQ